jgi:hypothetical protein
MFRWLAAHKDEIAALQAIFTIAGLLLAFVWFQGQHQTAPKLNIEQRFSQRPYLGSTHTEAEVLMGLQVWVTNVGSVSDYLEPGRVYIDEVNPVAARLYCETMVDTNVAGPCDLPPPPGPGFLERARRSTVLGWFCRPKSSSRWIEPGEKDQAFANEYRLDASTRTLRITSVFPSGATGFWKATDYYDLAPSAPPPVPTPAKRRPKALVNTPAPSPDAKTRSSSN